MSDKNLLQLPLATTGAGALIYGIQDNQDKAFPASVLQGSEQPQAANLVYAGPVAPPGDYPTFRPLVINDIPDLSTIYLKSNGGTLVGPTINNPNIVGGNISGTTIVSDDDKWSVRNALDTTKVIRFNVAPITAGQTRVFAWPDQNGTVVTNDATQTVSNKIMQLVASSSSLASFRIPHGQPPASPVNGDIWTTNAGLYAQINNATVGPFAAAASSTVTTFNGRQGAVTLTFADVTNALGYTPYNPGTDQYVKKSGDVLTGQLKFTGNINQISMVNGAQERLWILTAGGDSGIFDQTAGVWGVRYGADGGLYTRRGIFAEGQIRSSANLFVTAGNPAASSRPLGLSAGLDCDATNGRSQIFAYNYASTNFQPMDYRASEHVFNSRITAPDVRTIGATSALIFQERGWARDWAWYASGGQAKLNVLTVGDVMSITTGGVCHVSGYYTATGGFGPGSDPKLKDSNSFRPIDNALDMLYNLNVTYGKYHDWYNPDGKERMFLMADENMKRYAPSAIIPELISVEDKKYDGWSADQMIALLVKAVQDLTEKVEELEDKLHGR